MTATDPPPWVLEALASARVARLGTVGRDGAVRMVPICFAVVDGWVVSAVDHKPKRTGQLARLDDIADRGQATVLVDHYDEDWTQLWWVRVRGRAEVLAPDAAATAAVDALVAKHEQYRVRRPSGVVYRIALDELRWWHWSGASPPV
ncbi:MAG: TIGR03668 family PPOX class F420-dependent oxidoreductase [Ilumatobacteraceae bacterium]